MKKFFLKAQRDSPEIVLDPDNGVLSIIGVSHPENITKFFEPVMAWLEAFEQEIAAKYLNKNIKIVFFFKYFNSATYKYLLTVLKRLQEISNQGVTFFIEWKYERDDEDMKDSGLELFEFSGIKIPYVVTEADLL